jgi:hypothetical protein
MITIKDILEYIGFRKNHHTVKPKLEDDCEDEDDDLPVGLRSLL